MAQGFSKHLKKYIGSSWISSPNYPNLQENKKTHTNLPKLFKNLQKNPTTYLRTYLAQISRKPYEPSGLFHITQFNGL